MGSRPQPSAPRHIKVDMPEEKEQFKYLAVRNWAKYQGRMKFTKGAKRDKIWMASHLDTDPDYSQLTCLQRYVLDGLRRLTALHGHNPHNDPTTVCRQLAVLPQERHNVARVIPQLVHRGLLILTNDKDPFSQSLLRASDVDVMRGDEKRGEVPPAAASSTPETEDQTQDVEYFEVNIPKEES
jgi:hypothetical protein